MSIKDLCLVSGSLHPSFLGFNYLKNNYVRTVFCSVCDRGRCVVVKAKVNPSRESPDLAKEPWIFARKEGVILSAHCTCKAG